MNTSRTKDERGSIVKEELTPTKLHFLLTHSPPIENSITLYNINKFIEWV